VGTRRNLYILKHTFALACLVLDALSKQALSLVSVHGVLVSLRLHSKLHR